MSHFSEQDQPTHADLLRRVSAALAEMTPEEVADSVRQMRAYARAVEMHAQIRWPGFRVDEPPFSQRRRL
jgi:hypothetical protein